MKAQARPAKPPPLAAWDFLGGCPKRELERCCFYEYALEKPAIVKLVELRRQKPEQFRLEGDNVGTSILDSWFGNPARVLVEYSEFPTMHWLEIDPARRREMLRKLPRRSRVLSPAQAQQSKYTGPEPGHLTRLKAEQLAWQYIEEEKETVLGWFLTARNVQSRRSLPDRCSAYLTEAEVTHWRKKLSKLKGEQLRSATTKLRQECERKIEKWWRDPHELIPYEIDWTQRHEKLMEDFDRFVKANRVHAPRPRSGGHPTTPVELLKALGAKRLLAFFRQHQDVLPLPYKAQQLHKALADYSRDMRRTAKGRRAKPLYSKPSGWNDAENTAAEAIERF